MTLSPADLTGTERAVLLVLMAESRPVPNPDLLALGPKLDKPAATNSTSSDSSNRSVAVDDSCTSSPTAAGACAATSPPPARRRDQPALGKPSTPCWAPYIATCAAPTSASPMCSEPMTTNRRPNTSFDMPMPDSRRGPADGQPHPASHRACRHPAGRARRRPADAESHPGVSLIPEENQKVLTAADRDAAIVIGDHAKHLLAIEP